MTNGIHSQIKIEAENIAASFDISKVEDYIVRWTSQMLGPTAITELINRLQDEHPEIANALESLLNEVSGVELMDDTEFTEVEFEHISPESISIMDDEIRELVIRDPRLDEDELEWEEDPEDSDLRSAISDLAGRMSRGR